MKIGVIGYVLNPRSGARAALDLAYSLRKIGHEVHFYSFSLMKDPNTLKKFENDGIKVHLIEKSKTLFVGFFSDFYNLSKLLRKTKPDIVNTHIPLSLFLAPWANGIPTALSYHGTQFNVLDERMIEKNIITKPVNFVINIVIYLKTLISVRLATVVIGISKYTQKEAKRLYKRIDARLIYSGNAPSEFTTQTKVYRAKNKKIKILSVSRITPYKQFEKTINAVRDIPNVNLTIAGSSPQSKYLKFLRSLKNQNTKILINIPDTVLAGLYKECDIYASCDKYLFFGMPILEAATFAKPSVSLNYAAASELISHGKTGYVAKNQKEFEKYIKALVDSPSLRDKMGREATNWAKNFTWDKTAKNYEKIFKKILRQKIF
ncbi:hypothetical protein A3D00_05725 [Candidatus Woesebacteria bacterium RIFCSPHIGHO2_02_FULL_38_9]|uniref:Glycosyltransferase subfamily 4-like N-terminal domain-containing protein n=1 Tax=Candidatus Woesebacteria bacterium RIFCSPHIGHO2_01_FULL_39_28 TaxID=1802496 RepID=A0A1F7YKE6_9BACT|nr:MAG: hypothetical protein A2627_02400 [Candidatus Woesebacteria bacterium RIFCSPHIGHO2_01_FULL_39_28]OGM34430.1 MAG: hypothetical protein A3D00_05725 [Candidatus Woesebacteria bacterium RIFCSPHIGHO2_02_FULL_38_9]OGM57178.1 MAG: hypothetical protein A3A50_03260 [Candidatus Woesebacteria bacterium RIFCSPLOWO2_01_FULL_38_20]